MKVVGKADYQPDAGAIRFSDLPGQPVLHEIGAGFGFDHQGNLLVTETSAFGQDVYRFPVPIPALGGGSISRPDQRLFYPPGGVNFMGVKGLLHADGIAVYQDQLVVSGAHRLMFWNGLDDLTNGRSADGIVGDPELRRYQDSCCEHVKHDGAGRLWVNSSEGVPGFIDVYQLPLTHQSAPLETVWVKGKRLPVLGANETLSSIDGRIWGIAPAEGGKFLWISDTDNHRVVRIRDPLTDPVVDVILGQHTPRGDQCNRGRTVTEFAQRSDITPDMLCFPGNVVLGRHGNLWVSDHALEVSGNYRMLMFSKSLFPDDSPSAIFAPEATRTFPRHGAKQPLSALYDPRASSNLIEEHLGGPYPTAAFEPAFDSQNRMIVGYNFYIGGRFVGIYEDPLGGATEPSGYLNDLASMPVAAAFDNDDNLYVGDHNRARVLVYKNPSNNPSPREEDQRDSTPAAPLTDYAANIDAVSPEPTACVLRDATRGLPSNRAGGSTVELFMGPIIS